MCPRLFSPAAGSHLRSSAMKASAFAMLSSHILSTAGGVGVPRLIPTRCECSGVMDRPAAADSIWHMPSTDSPPAPVYSPLNRRMAVPAGGVLGTGTRRPSSAASISRWSMCDRSSSCGRKSTFRVFPFLDVLVILNESLDKASATHFFQSSSVREAANSASAAASAAASKAAASSSSSAEASGIPSPFLPASKKL